MVLIPYDGLCERLWATDAKPSAIEFTRIAEARRRKTEGESTAVFTIWRIPDTKVDCHVAFAPRNDNVFYAASLTLLAELI